MGHPSECRRGVGACGRSAGSTPAAMDSTRRRGAPRLHEWMERRDAILSTIRISSRLAPAASAARMCRRVLQN
jgi:hypothetical protein